MPFISLVFQNLSDGFSCCLASLQLSGLGHHQFCKAVEPWTRQHPFSANSVPLFFASCAFRSRNCDAGGGTGPCSSAGSCGFVSDFYFHPLLWGSQIAKKKNLVSDDLRIDSPPWKMGASCGSSASVHHSFQLRLLRLLVSMREETEGSMFIW